MIRQDWDVAAHKDCWNARQERWGEATNTTEKKILRRQWFCPSFALRRGGSCGFPKRIWNRNSSQVVQWESIQPCWCVVGVSKLEYLDAAFCESSDDRHHLVLMYSTICSTCSVAPLASFLQRHVLEEETTHEVAGCPGRAWKHLRCLAVHFGVRGSSHGPMSRNIRKCCVWNGFYPIHQSLEQWYKLTASDMGEVSSIWFEYQDLDHETIGNSLIFVVHPQYSPFKSSNSNSEVLSFSILLYSTICHRISMLQCWHGIRCFFCGGCNGE